MWVVCIDEHTHTTQDTTPPQKKQNLKKKICLSSQQILSRFWDMIVRRTNYTRHHKKHNFVLEKIHIACNMEINYGILFEERKCEC
jgi:hypothetical protein